MNKQLYQQTLTIECPTCGAPTGKPCIDSQLWPGTITHIDRFPALDTILFKEHASSMLLEYGDL